MRLQYLSLALLALLAGCGSTKSSRYQPADNAVSSGINGVYSGGNGYMPGGSSSYDPASNGDYYNNPAYGKNVVGGPRAEAKDRVIYFSYDSSNIDARAQAIIAAHARYLSRNSRAKIVLEGHTDSRGSREYNVALGERRALSVKQRLLANGADARQIRIVSYGEEKPAVRGYSERAYQSNRRAVIQYQ